MGSVLFLIGAGASVDAGMPLVTQLTTELRDRLPNLRDINGERRSEFAALFDAIAEYDPQIRQSYERFFEWLDYLTKGQSGTFRNAVEFKLDRRLVDSVPYLIASVGGVVKDILSSRNQGPSYQPDYFSKLGDFLPERGRLPVFSTNYDLCVEDACRSHGISVVTGFVPYIGNWAPSLFRRSGPGINLFKLHSSLNWHPSSPLSNLKDQSLVEDYPPRWDLEPELILGPRLKLQHDEPFVTLYAEFHRVIKRAKVCVAIGCSFSDRHIKEPLRAASSRGLKIIEVNPSPVGLFPGGPASRRGAKEAFESGEILSALNVL